MMNLAFDKINEMLNDGSMTNDIENHDNPFKDPNHTCVFCKKAKELRDEIENMLFQYWDALPHPKKTQSEYFYGNGGVKDFLDNFHKLEK